ncbi:MAG TPA: arginine deiminase family protein [Blastocatellia bacterium]|jgi:dimethylargininase|nr:arginine deiminase family protein [Blastocatellia bacterium]
MLRALTHKISPALAECELTFVARSPIDLQLATRQHDDYRAALTRLGVTVEELSGNESYPDSCFVEDTAIVVDELAIMCSMGVASRRGETPLIERELSRYRYIERIELPATIEGGDVLRVGKKILVGDSSRTNGRGIGELARILEPSGYEIIPVKTKGSLHFKSACTALNDETLIVNPDWVELEALAGFALVHTPEGEPWSANVLRVGSTACVQAGFPRSAELVERVTGSIEVIDISELRKAEAGLTCSSIVFESAV